jgi:4-hydroxy-tetrahydrodipicolinate reductase
VRVALFGHRGKVGSVVGPALEASGHAVRGIGRGDPCDLDGLDAAVDFTTPEAVAGNVRASLEADMPAIVGTSGLQGRELEQLEELARERSLALLVVPNFAVGAVLMMRFAAEAAEHLSSAAIIELHHETKKDAPSGTARATRERLPGEPPIHSVRLPGLVAHQEVLLGGEGQLLTIRHDTFSREAFVPGVLLAVERLATLQPGLTVGLDVVLGETNR